MSDHSNDKEWWLDKPANIRLIIWALVVICIALALADFLYHKHGHFEFEQWPAFYAWYGFLSYCTIVLSAKQLRKFLSRKEDYYDAEDSDVNNEIDQQTLMENYTGDGADNDRS